MIGRKVLFVALLAGSSALADQPAPIRRDPETITNRIEDLVITNSIGDVFKNLKLSRVTPEGLLLGNKAGLVKAKWNDLPPWCLEKYGDAGRAARLKENQDALASARFRLKITEAQLADLEEKNRVEARLRAERDARAANATVGTPWLIKGRIIQRARDGLLIQSVGGHSGTLRTLNVSIINPKETRTIREGGMSIYEGLCLLKNHPDEAGFVDGDQVNIQASDSGTYEYTSVAGSRRTIKQFTAY